MKLLEYNIEEKKEKEEMLVEFFRLKRNDTRWKCGSLEEVKCTENGIYVGKYKKLYFFIIKTNSNWLTKIITIHSKSCIFYVEVKYVTIVAERKDRWALFKGSYIIWDLILTQDRLISYNACHNL